MHILLMIIPEYAFSLHHWSCHFQMRRTLRRSCAACAKAKHSCDLQTPKCSRCQKRKVDCVYANQPLNSVIGTTSSNLPGLSMTIGSRALDPFNSYPATALRPQRVQGLMHHCKLFRLIDQALIGTWLMCIVLSKIAFQYYPLDMNPASNPFITSWWPRALADPALFHVSLQTASLDDEFHAKKGFLHSELLMKDSLSLIW